MTVSWDDEIPNKWKHQKCSKPPTSFYPIEPPLIAWKNRWVIPCLIQGRDRPRKGEAISGGGFVARHRGPQSIPRWDTGHKLLLRVAFEPPTGKRKDGKVLLDTTNSPQKKMRCLLVFTFFNGSILGVDYGDTMGYIYIYKSQCVIYGFAQKWETYLK